MEYSLKEEIGGKTLSIQTGKVAKQASGSVVVQYGDTVVLVTVVSTHEETARRLSAADGGVPGEDLRGRANPGQLLSP